VGVASQTTTSEVDLTVDLTQLAVRQDLLVGLYHPMATGAGFASLTLDIYVGAPSTPTKTRVLHDVFTSVAQATAFFTNNAIDLGSLATVSGNTLSLRAVMSVTSTGGTFNAGLILGDPPASRAGNVTVAGFAHSMAGLGGPAAGSIAGPRDPMAAGAPRLAAPRT
jgi:hypothetical protein